MEGLLEFPLGSERRIGAAHLGRSQTLSGSARRLAPALSNPATRARRRPSVGRGVEQISEGTKIKRGKMWERFIFFVMLYPICLWFPQSLCACVVSCGRSSSWTRTGTTPSRSCSSAVWPWGRRARSPTSHSTSKTEKMRQKSAWSRTRRTRFRRPHQHFYIGESFRPDSSEGGFCCLSSDKMLPLYWHQRPEHEELIIFLFAILFNYLL